MATVDVLLAIRDWRQRLAAIQSFGRVFLWNGVSYIRKLATDVPALKQTLVITTSPTAMPNPFFLPCTLESLLAPSYDTINWMDDMDATQRLRDAASVLFHDQEFIQLWKDSALDCSNRLLRYNARHHATTHPFLDQIRASQLEFVQKSSLFDTSPGLRLLCHALLHHLHVDCRWDPKHLLRSLLEFQPADMASSAEVALTDLFANHPSAHPSKLFGDHAVCASLSLFVLHILVQLVGQKRKCSWSS
ncbi:hypothetical protein DYB28_008169 [Aphanomyces astaci]|uniref:Uncharacterized protein n=1 Tax=Aphanomyces astaci TaxID=112090 RepID=A0A9X8E6V8_APHAT|nr:hypothetical protein DYB28_008169 [Aphanomyces astaci]